MKLEVHAAYGTRCLLPNTGELECSRVVTLVSTVVILLSGGVYTELNKKRETQWEGWLNA